MVSPDIPVTVFENVSLTLNDSKVMHSVEVWDLEERWEEKETIIIIIIIIMFKKGG
jgi:hypothetical protein